MGRKEGQDSSICNTGVYEYKTVLLASWKDNDEIFMGRLFSSEYWTGKTASRNATCNSWRLKFESENAVRMISSKTTLMYAAPQKKRGCIAATPCFSWLPESDKSGQWIVVISIQQMAGVDPKLTPPTSKADLQPLT
jgi:hypothetical protein